MGRREERITEKRKNSEKIEDVAGTNCPGELQKSGPSHFNYLQLMYVWGVCFAQVTSFCGQMNIHGSQEVLLTSNSHVC